MSTLADAPSTERQVAGQVLFHTSCGGDCPGHGSPLGLRGYLTKLLRGEVHAQRASLTRRGGKSPPRRRGTGACGRGRCGSTGGRARRPCTRSSASRGPVFVRKPSPSPTGVSSTSLLRSGRCAGPRGSKSTNELPPADAGGVAGNVGMVNFFCADCAPSCGTTLASISWTSASACLNRAKRIVSRG
jgi:hypothetical protein